MPEIPFQISHLNSCHPEEGKIYLFDANVWLMIISPPSHLRQNEKEYVDFFEAIINLSSNALCKSKPVIFVNSLIISEVYNAFVKINCKAYNDVEGLELKPKEYRRTSDYKDNLDRFRSDFAAYGKCLAIHDNFNPEPLFVLNNLGVHSDYNDHFYYHLAIYHRMSIVTNDGDFIYRGVEIITNNNRVLKAAG